MSNNQQTNVDATLAERGTRYGQFDAHARITQNIKRAMIGSLNWDSLDDDMREALDMLAHKVGRILNGDPTYADSWHDIAGYVRLVEQRLEEPKTEPVPAMSMRIDPIETWRATPSPEEA
jgi:uncharacterized protein (UPF0297 family)